MICTACSTDVVLRHGLRVRGHEVRTTTPSRARSSTMGRTMSDRDMIPTSASPSRPGSREPG